ncbi:hydroxypyruvate isomerase family protein [Rhodovulum sp. DZ06]|uniref:hydroxypyruvate isomerase family protein n=1 Tax=Rhodovulum sp. DZ06 TaxID=3425126 RepID=UPI003D33D89B
MTVIAANLGLMYRDRPLTDAIAAAAADGFDAVEFQFPYDTPAEETAAALRAAGIPALGLNTPLGTGPCALGFAAVPGYGAEARAAIDRAFAYAEAIGARAVHVMAGETDGGPAADAAYRDALSHACDRAAEGGRMVLIEPLNPRQAPRYHLGSAEQGAEVIEALARPELKLMYDLYHQQILQGDLVERFKALAPLVGHVQFAAVPDRGAPAADLSGGEIHVGAVLRAIRDAGYGGAAAAEYIPGAPGAGALDWLPALRAALA